MGGKIKFKLKKKKIYVWQLILILIPLLFLLASLLRINHQKMDSLRQDVISADEVGDPENLKIALEKLAEYTRKNIVINITEENGKTKIVFGTGPFYLEQSYVRDATKALNEASSQIIDDSNPYGNIFAEAMGVCQPQAISLGWAWSSPEYLNCMTGEINKYPASEELKNEAVALVPSTELYRREFSSKIWSFSLAGMISLICLALIVAIIVKITIWIILRLSLLFLK